MSETFLDPNGLPVNDLLEVLQSSSDHPAIAGLSDDQWYRIENCLREDIVEQSVPILIQDAITYHDTALIVMDRKTKTNRTYQIREMQFADTLQIAEIGPQIIKIFFDNDISKVSQMNQVDVINQLINKAFTKNINGMVSALTYKIVDILAGLIIDPETQEYMNADFIYGQRPEVSIEIIRQILSVETLFFSYVQQSLPEGLSQGLSTVGGLFTKSILGGSQKP